MRAPSYLVVFVVVVAVASAPLLPPLSFIRSLCEIPSAALRNFPLIARSLPSICSACLFNHALSAPASYETFVAALKAAPLSPSSGARLACRICVGNLELPRNRAGSYPNHLSSRGQAGGRRQTISAEIIIFMFEQSNHERQSHFFNRLPIQYGYQPTTSSRELLLPPLRARRKRRHKQNARFQMRALFGGDENSRYSNNYELARLSNTKRRHLHQTSAPCAPAGSISQPASYLLPPALPNQHRNTL